MRNKLVNWYIKLRDWLEDYVPLRADPTYESFPPRPPKGVPVKK